MPRKFSAIQKQLHKFKNILNIEDEAEFLSTLTIKNEQRFMAATTRLKARTHNTDYLIYLIHDDTAEEFKGTKTDFINKTGFSKNKIHRLESGVRQSYKGWRVITSEHHTELSKDYFKCSP